MPAELRFHLDESIPMPDAIAGALRRAGIDVTTTADAGLRTEDDLAHWEFAQQSERVIVTCDADFLRMHNQDPRHAGIVFYEQQARGIGHIIEWLSLIHGVLSPDEMRGNVQFI
ncbi:MAG: DUF5615 family PIN-like protein [Candidatus Brachytrichaceae bacterium NZ_4S206]|jgi:hypothetical protein